MSIQYPFPMSLRILIWRNFTTSFSITFIPICPLLFRVINEEGMKKDSFGSNLSSISLVKPLNISFLGFLTSTWILKFLVFGSEVLEI